MKKEIADELAANLRSGQFKQGREKLRVERGEDSYYCCLGVLCEMAVAAGVIPRPEAQPRQDGVTVFIYDRVSTALLPESVRRWAGMSTTSGQYKQIAGPLSLVSHNDHGKSFDEIADIIEQEWTLL